MPVRGEGRQRPQQVAQQASPQEERAASVPVLGVGPVEPRRQGGAATGARRRPSGGVPRSEGGRQGVEGVEQAQGPAQEVV